MRINRRLALFAGFLVAGLAVTVAMAQTAPDLGGKISPEDAKSMLATDKGAVLLDVRTAEEFESNRIAGAVLLPYDAIDAGSAKRLIPGADATVIVYCRSGRRSAIAAETLRSLGYRRVFDLGGINAWPYGTVTSPPER